MAGWQFWIDRGGTFTDIVARSPEGVLSTAKLLSESPGRYPDAAVAGIKTILGIGLTADLPGGQLDEVKMGTTVATNALLERKGARTLLIVDRGFADLLTIGNQARPRLFDLAFASPRRSIKRLKKWGDGSTLRGGRSYRSTKPKPLRCSSGGARKVLKRSR